MSDPVEIGQVLDLAAKQVSELKADLKMAMHTVRELRWMLDGEQARNAALSAELKAAQEALDREARGEVTIHGCPANGEALTPCCQRTPFELPRTDRLSIYPHNVNCDRMKLLDKVASDAKFIADRQLEMDHVQAVEIPALMEEIERLRLFHIPICVFCGQSYPEFQGKSQAAMVTAHLLGCESHPARKLAEELGRERARAEKAERQLKETQGYLVVERERIGEHLRCAAERDVALARAEMAERLLGIEGRAHHEARMEMREKIEKAEQATKDWEARAKSLRESGELGKPFSSNGAEWNELARLAHDESQGLALASGNMVLLGRQYMRGLLRSLSEALLWMHGNVTLAGQLSKTHNAALTEQVGRLTEERNAAQRKAAERERDFGTLSKEKTKLRAALSDLAAGDEACCLVSHTGEGTLECAVHDGQTGCIACQASRRVVAAEQERDALRGQLAERDGEVSRLRAYHEAWQEASDCETAVSLAGKLEEQAAELSRLRASLERQFPSLRRDLKKVKAQRRDLTEQLTASCLATETTAKERDALFMRCGELERVVEVVRAWQYCTCSDAACGHWARLLELQLPEPPKVTKSEKS